MEAQNRKGSIDSKKDNENNDSTNVSIIGALFSILRYFTFFILKLMFLVITSIVVSCSIFISMSIVKAAEDIPSLEEIKSYNINIPSIVYDRNNEVIAKLFTENRNLVELKEISPWMIKAALAAEDADFYSHNGISIQGIARALWADIQQKLYGTGTIQGGSTITQQLARNLFLSQERTLTRKIKEILISFRIEEIYSKDEILEMYMNTIYFGRGAWGVDTASRTYFGKPASELSVAESAVLVGLIPAPNKYNPMTDITTSKTRQSYVLDRMKSLGWISSLVAKEAKYEELVFKHIPNIVEEYNRAPYFVSWVLFNELLPKYGTEKVYGGGLEIYTTVDIRLQDKAQEIITKMENQGALAAIQPGSCEVLALVGGKDFNESKFNRATQAYRQPGSSFKPFIYGAAIETGLRPSDHFIDGKLKFGSGGRGKKEWLPTNYDGKYHGEVTMLYALTKSLNTVPIRCIAHIGAKPVINFAKKAGITTPYLPDDMSLALGSASLTPLEMAFAFSVFANSGKRAEKPVFIREIRSWKGDILEVNEPKIIQAISPETSWTILSMLFDVITAGTGTRAKIPNTQVFGKTGTTNDFIDAWFIGGVPGLVASVYTGKDDNKTLGKGVTGGTIAAPPWKEFITYAISTLGLKSKFDVPTAEMNVSLAGICRQSGFLATSGCPTVPLYLKRGSAPTTKCPVHGGTGSVSDSRAPVLITIAQDDDLLRELEEALELTLIAQANEAAAIAAAQKQSAPPPPKPNPVVPAAPKYVVRYVEDDPKPVSVQDRYEKLLEEYGINN
ncbi:MAG: PBP1A family penicillin-binding protein [Synergistaceae bacterium]|nr:PBP1A family penicillin-binding protein [Synergistaceae bacterium]